MYIINKVIKVIKTFDNPALIFIDQRRFVQTVLSLHLSQQT